MEHTARLGAFCCKGYFTDLGNACSSLKRIVFQRESCCFSFGKYLDPVFFFDRLKDNGTHDEIGVPDKVMGLVITAASDINAPTSAQSQ